MRRLWPTNLPGNATVHSLHSKAMLVTQDSLIPAWLTARTWNWYNTFSFSFSTWTQGKMQSHLKVVLVLYITLSIIIFIPTHRKSLVLETRFTNLKKMFQYSESVESFQRQVWRAVSETIGPYMTHYLPLHHLNHTSQAEHHKGASVKPSQNILNYKM